MQRVDLIPRETCKHSRHMPEFDEAAARKLPTSEIRTRWPRFFGVCTQCGGSVILYASRAHYVCGDW